MKNKKIISELIAEISQSNLPGKTIQEWTDKLQIIDRIYDRLTFQIKRYKVDKDIVMNLLNSNVQELEERHLDLEEKNRIIAEQMKFKEMMLVNVNHELRTPLNAIIGMGSLLEDTDLDRNQRKYMKTIKRSTNNLFVIINDFLTLNSLNANKLEIKNEPFNIRELFGDIHSTFKLQCIDKGLDFQVNLAYDMPEFFLGDASRVYQILQNLLGNAVKITPKGKIVLTGRVKKDTQFFKVLEFTISDTGIGIPEEHLKSIFETFAQVHSYGDKDHMGTGLGLNIVKSLLDKMNGDISVESTEGKGSTFTLSIPLQSISKDKIINEPGIEINIPESWKEKKFLMIEDNPANIVYAREIFRKWNLNLKVKETYTDGLKEARKNFYDLILSDLKLPDGNGIELLRNIRNDNKAACCDTNMVIVTASILDSDKAESRSLNISSYIEKPFVPVQLFEEMYGILETDTQSLELFKNFESDDSLALRQNIEDSLNGIAPGNSKIQLEFVLILLKQLDEEGGLMEEGIKKKDLKKIFHSAHKIKSSIKILGIAELGKVNFVIEENSRHNKNMHDIKTAFKQFKQLSAVYKPILKGLAEELRIRAGIKA